MKTPRKIRQWCEEIFRLLDEQPNDVRLWMKEGTLVAILVAFHAAEQTAEDTAMHLTALDNQHRVRVQETLAVQTVFRRFLSRSTN